MVDSEIRVLLVEDDPGDARLVGALLADSDHGRFHVEHVEHLSGALQQLSSRRPDVVLLDLGLPDGAAFEALSTLTARAPDLPVVVLTWASDSRLALRVMSAGAQDYLDKPEMGGALLARTLRHAVERMQAQRRLRLTQRAVDHSAEAIYWISADGLFQDVNEAACSSLGYAREELLGKAVHDVDPDFGAWEHGFLPVLKESGSERVFSRHRRKDGTAFGVEVVFNHLEYDGADHVVAFARDASERGAAEGARAFVPGDPTESRRAEERYRSLFEHAAYGIYRSSLDGRFLSVNAALVDILGYDSAEAVLDLDLAKDLYADESRREALVEGYRDADRIDSVDVEWKTRDGRRITVRESGRTVRDADGRLTGFEMIVEDVTERRRLEAQLRQAQKMEAIGQLTGGIAHDFNNLLSIILLNAELLRDELERGEPIVAADLDDIEGAARRAAVMTQQLLGFSRRTDLRFASTDLVEVVHGLARMLRRILPADIEISVRAPTPVRPVRADATAIEQILLNLATNARDAMPDGGHLGLDIEEEELDGTQASAHPGLRPGSFVSLSVSDTGCGMPADVAARYFEPFFTTKPMGKGTGLGGAMVYGLMKQHRGFVYVSSVPDQGTTVRLLLPLATDADAKTVDPPAAEATTGGAETILLVEDGKVLLEVGAKALERGGYTVLTAESAEEALEVYREHADSIRLVISDVVMPGMGGVALYNALKATAPSLPFLMVSGHAAGRSAELAGLDPSVAFLQKPWTLSGLLGSVRSALDQRERPKNLRTPGGTTWPAS